MLSDEDSDGSEYALDVWFFLSADHWQLAHGGQVSYIARGEDEEVFLKKNYVYKCKTTFRNLSMLVSCLQFVHPITAWHLSTGTRTR